MRERLTTCLKMGLVGLLLASFFFGHAPMIGAAQKTDDCDPAAVRDWMVQRQIGRNQIQQYLDVSKVTHYLKALLAVQEIRRNLEDLPRPACADKFYILTVYLYDSLTDCFTLEASGDGARAQELFAPRLDFFNKTVDSLYLPLQSVAEVDIKSVAATEAAMTPSPSASPTLAATEQSSPTVTAGG